MGPGEKKVAAFLVVVLIALVVVYFTTAPKPAAGPVSAGIPAAAGGGAQASEVQEFGKAGAKLEITALVPVVNPCHAKTIAALKEVYEAHSDEIHLTIIDFMGPDAEEWRNKLGVTCATISINGNSEFEVEGRRVTLQRQEGGSYQPSDLRPVIEAELAKLGRGDVDSVENGVLASP